MDTGKYHSSDSCIYTRACGTRVNTCYQTRDISLYQCCNIIIIIGVILNGDFIQSYFRYTIMSFIERLSLALSAFWTVCLFLCTESP